MFTKIYPQTLRIKVTQYDIDNGEVGQPQSCPIALALNRMFPDNWEVSVGGDTISIDGICYGSMEAFDFISRFDETGNVYPTTLEINRA